MDEREGLRYDGWDEKERSLRWYNGSSTSCRV